MKTNTTIIVAWLLLLWFGLGSMYRTWSLSLWREDVATAAAHAVMPLPGADDARDFLLAYQRMEDSHLLIHALTYIKANNAHQRWAAHYR